MTTSALKPALTDATESHWHDWRWQQRQAVRTADQLQQSFPGLQDHEVDQIRKAEAAQRYQLTPYVLNLVETDASRRPLTDDPIWKISVPSTPSTIQQPELGDNWELPEDMKSPILQHKYPDRAVLRIQNRCLGYCMYCFEAKRVLVKEKGASKSFDFWLSHATKYLSERPAIQEVVLSGGDPFLMGTDQLDDILARLRAISSVRTIRINTSAFVHNPFRITDALVEVLARHRVTALGLHFSHPQQLTDELDAALDRFRDGGCRTLLLAQTPLLRGVNDDEDVLRELFLGLYARQLVPYYLLHTMPETLAGHFRTPVLAGVRLMRALKRKMPNPAMPEYIIVHKDGKQTVPLTLGGTEEFRYEDGEVRFLNWQGQWCSYPDAEADRSQKEVATDQSLQEAV